MAKNVNKASLRAVLITALVLVVLFAIYFGIRSLLNRSTGNEERLVDNTNEVLSNTPQDTDADGLPDYFENLYRTDVTNSDTDGDGVTDFDELELGRDPIIPGPDDESKPPSGDDVAALDTFTQKYLAGLPTDAGREEVLDKERLEAFVELNKGPLLPELAEGTIVTTTGEGAAVIETYLESISTTHNQELAAALHCRAALD